MSHNIFAQLTNILAQDDRFVSQDGVHLLKNSIQECIRKNDRALITLLLSDSNIKKHLFYEVAGVLIFDKEKCIRVISNTQFLPSSYTAFKNKIGLTSGGEYLSKSKEVVLAWPYKDCVLEGGMTKEKHARNEIFYNETLAPDDITRLLDPKAFTDFKRIDKAGQHTLDGFTRDKHGTITDNLIIKGNNLLALASLQQEFAGKVKLIYIDPPYNTGNDGFKYNDSFNHSSWLTFMKNRLEVARALLRDDGVIFVQCDDNEQAYLKVLTDDIFGRENFVHSVIRVTTKRVKGDAKNINSIHDYIHIYSKKYNNITVFHKEKIYGDDSIYNLEDKHVKKRGNFLLRPLDNGTINYSKKLDYIIDAPNGEKICAGGDFKLRKNRLDGKAENKDWCFRWSEKKFHWGIKNDFIIFKAVHNKQRVYFKIYQHVDNSLNDVEKYDNFLSIVENCYNNKGTSEIKGIFGNNRFSYPKPESLLHNIMDAFTKPSDIILDYHLGSGTTAAVAHKMGRQYIGIEQMDYIETVAVERLKKVIAGEQGGISKSVHWQGGGNCVYMELAQWNETWIKKITAAHSGTELTALWHELKTAAFLSYKVDPATVDANADAFAALSLEDQKKFLNECIDKNHLYINMSEMADTTYHMSADDQRLNKNFYNSR